MDKLTRVLFAIDQIMKCRLGRIQHPSEAMGCIIGELDWLAELHDALGLPDACI